MALERVRAKRDAKGKNRLRFLQSVASAGAKLFTVPAISFRGLKELERASGPLFDTTARFTRELNEELANVGIDLSRKAIAFSDAITDLAAEVSPLDKRAERVLDGLLDFPAEAYFRAWIFTLEFYLSAIEEGKANRKTRMKEPRAPLPKQPERPPRPVNPQAPERFL